MDAIADVESKPGLAPFSLKDAPALIERVFPAQKVGIEAQKERTASKSQTLTALGSYWKGRKPLVMVRACLLASLLPATEDADGDLELFEALMRMDPEGISRRDARVAAQHVADCRLVTEDAKARHLIRADAAGAPMATKWRRFEASKDLDKAERVAARVHFDEEREAIRQLALSGMSFTEQVAVSDRVEKVEDLRNDADPLYAGVFARANARLGTDARTLPELVQQLGFARFGHLPVVGDPFAGGGSIPFEAARVGCDVVASDLNPIATMLTWGALNIIGADETKRAEIVAERARVAETVDSEITQLGIEHNARGDRAKVYLYCLETIDPRTGWRVPMAPSWVISRSSRCIAKMVPIVAQKRFDLKIVEGASTEEIAQAETGTVRDGFLVYRLPATPRENEEEQRVAISHLRGDGEGPKLPEGGRGNRLRPWTVSDVAPREPHWDPDASPVLAGNAPGAWVGGDIWLERLYCIQWMDGADLKSGKSRTARTFFASPSNEDFQRELKVRTLVEASLYAWQKNGLVPDMPIDAGKNTSQPIWERGWTHWHHLFSCRQVLVLSLVKRQASTPELWVEFALMLDRNSKLSRFDASGGGAGLEAKVQSAFYNQSLNTILNPAIRGLDFPCLKGVKKHYVCNDGVIRNVPVTQLSPCDLFIFDPPYADAVHYHEITEFFIAWLRKDPPAPFDGWTWDSRRPLAIQGKGEKFRSDMVNAFRKMAEHMPNNGLQVCMFTHQDAGVWADMAGIVWGAGLRVTAAWYVSTETTSDLKKGGYVQGTVLLVLRKRQGDERAYKDELVLEVRGAVQRQVDLLTGLNQRTKSRQRDDNPFSDADVQMAGYAAALEVLTGYTHIEGVDMTREALRPRVKGHVGIVEEMIALAVQTATELMRPDGIDENLWERLVPTERFWLKMMEAESNRPAGQAAGKLDDYQNFAKAYRADGWDDLMADRTPNKARLKSAVDFKRAMMTGHPFAGGLVRPVLYGVNELRMSAEKEEDHATSSERAISGLRDNLKSWAQQRQQAMIIADWLGRALARHRPAEASAARTLAALIRTERLG
jgi:putative DNA methylase